MMGKRKGKMRKTKERGEGPHIQHQSLSPKETMTGEQSWRST